MRSFPPSAISLNRAAHFRRVRRAHERRAGSTTPTPPTDFPRPPRDLRMERAVGMLWSLLEAVAGRRHANHLTFDLDVLDVLYDLPDIERQTIEDFIAACLARRASYIDVAELAIQWSFDPREIVAMAEAGELRGFLRDGQWVFRTADVARYLAENLYDGCERVMRQKKGA